ncbi:MAG: LysR family transcriptional regulator [Proteobacteria bacterium]|nr:LysR family transcriptional regulator [Pseudomonadota bacterium]
MDKLHLIKVFVAVADANGLARAARLLGLSPAAVTRAINELEAHLGMRLLTRTTRVVRVTDAGARYVADCREILANLAEAEASAAGRHSMQAGHLTVSASPLLGSRFVVPIITEYLQKHPDVSATCWFLDRAVNMTEEGVEVEVRVCDSHEIAPQAQQVGRIQRVICAAPEYLALHGRPRTPADLRSHAIVSAASVTPAAEWRLVQNGVARNIKLRQRLVTTDSDGAIVAALGGVGLACLLSCQVAEEVSAGKLEIVLSEFAAAALPVCVLHRAAPHATARTLAFVALAVERLRANPALN